MKSAVTAIGTASLHILADAGRTADLFFRALSSLRRPPYYLRALAGQMMEVGNRSLIVVLVTSAFSGAVFALQTWEGFEQFGATSLVGFAVSRSMTRELVPVLSALIVAGRVGSAMAAEIGTMTVTEQVDALRSMGTDPIKYLVVPRVLATAFMLPILVVIGDLVGIAGGYVVAVQLQGAPATPYWSSSFDYLTLGDITGGLVKACVFGIMIALFGCLRGFRASGGAAGVGKATTGAVVASSMTILISDFFLTKLLLTAWDW